MKSNELLLYRLSHNQLPLDSGESLEMLHRRVLQLSEIASGSPATQILRFTGAAEKTQSRTSLLRGIVHFSKLLFRSGRPELSHRLVEGQMSNVRSTEADTDNSC